MEIHTLNIMTCVVTMGYSSEKVFIGKLRHTSRDLNKNMEEVEVSTTDIKCSLTPSQISTNALSKMFTSNIYHERFSGKKKFKVSEKIKTV